MGADEVREGLARLGILHETTLPACPEQNGKQEAWWNSVEGRLLAMLERVPHFRAMKCTREHGGASHVREVRMEGRGFDLYNNLAVGVTWAAERLAGRTLTLPRSEAAAGARPSLALQAMRSPRRRRRRIPARDRVGGSD
jgi:transposase InsO family protein